MKNDIIVHPTRGIREKSIPDCGILFVNPTEARSALQVLLDRGGDQRFLFHSGLVVSPRNEYFVAGSSIGAPMAAMVLEKLIVLGAERVIMVGWCGAIDPELSVGDTIIGGPGYPGEGTSRYYGNEDRFFPSSRLLEKLQLIPHVADPIPIWSTDAPYRESRKMLKALSSEYNIGAVDMEYSALCAVAAFRCIDFASLFLVSDELWQPEWHPGFNGKVFKRKSKAQIKLLMNTIVELSTFQET